MKDNRFAQCQACHAQAERVFFKQAPFVYLLCESCGSLVLDPLPTTAQLQAFYSLPYYGNCCDDTGGGSKLLTYDALADRISDFAQGKPILEVGAGTGFFMDMLSIRKAQVWGIEPSESLAQLNPFFSTGQMFHALEELPSERVFSVAVYFDVIEHIVDLDEHLQNLHQRLETDGLVFFVTPDRSSFSAHLMRSKWPHLSIPEHITLFSRKGLEAATQRHGFAMVEVNSFPKKMNGDYLLEILRRYSRLKIDYLLFKLACILIPALGKLTIRIGTGHMLAIVRKL